MDKDTDTSTSSAEKAAAFIRGALPVIDRLASHGVTVIAVSPPTRSVQIDTHESWEWLKNAYAMGDFRVCDDYVHFQIPMDGLRLVACIRLAEAVALGLVPDEVGVDADAL